MSELQDKWCECMHVVSCHLTLSPGLHNGGLENLVSKTAAVTEIPGREKGKEDD